MKNGNENAKKVRLSIIRYRNLLDRVILPNSDGFEINKTRTIDYDWLK
jgi:hypothetical protein